jgi:uncharacterized protein YbjT (DUF2867 family)
VNSTNQNPPQAKPILVLGSSGKTGRRVATRLTERGIPVRLASRTGETPFDWENSSTWQAALQGVGAVYVNYYPDLAMPNAADDIAAFAKLAMKNGVKRLVLLSGRGEPGAQRAEQALQRSGADWTILRASWFAQNFSESFLLEPILAGEVSLPVADVREPFIDVDDIADAAVAALSDDAHIGQLYEITGPRAITFAEAVAEIANASGRTIRYATISQEAFLSSLTSQGVPGEMIGLMTELFSEVLDGRNTDITDGIRRVLNREPTDFAEYASKTAASGVWSGGE